MSEPGLVHCFSVTVDVHEGGQTDLGSFTRCQGLNVACEPYAYQEGGQNGFVHQLPAQVKFGAVSLTRPLDSSSAAVAAWLGRLQTKPVRTTARIAALDTAGEEVAAWTLMGVWPREWTGPTFQSEGNAVATESLTLVHEGFGDEQ